MNAPSPEDQAHEARVQSFLTEAGLSLYQIKSIQKVDGPMQEEPVGLDVIPPNDVRYSMEFPEDQVIAKVLVGDAFKKAFDHRGLTQRQAATIFRHVILEETYEQIAETQGLTRERSRQIEMQAKAKLRTRQTYQKTFPEVEPLSEPVVAVEESPATVPEDSTPHPMKESKPRAAVATKQSVTKQMPPRTEPTQINIVPKLVALTQLPPPPTPEKPRQPWSRGEKILAGVIAGGVGLIALWGVNEVRQSTPPTAEPLQPTAVFDDLDGGSSIIQVYPGVQNTQADRRFSGTFKDGQTATAECQAEGRFVQSDVSVGEQARSSTIWVRIHNPTNSPQYATTVYLQTPDELVSQLPYC